VPYNPVSGEHASLGPAQTGIVIGKTDDSGITAISGTTVGSGKVEIHRMAVGSTTLIASGTTVTCYNMAGVVDPEEYVAMVRDAYGRFWVVVENC
jgi:hypothetical protein